MIIVGAHRVIIKKKKQRVKTGIKKGRQVVNPAYLYQCAGNDKAKLSGYIKLYLKSVSELVSRLNEGVRNKDCEDIMSAVHDLKSLLAIVSVKSVERELAEIRKSASLNANMDAISSAIKKVESVCNGISAELKRLIVEVERQ